MDITSRTANILLMENITERIRKSITITGIIFHAIIPVLIIRGSIIVRMESDDINVVDEK
ncbi:hypothetical protein [Kiloniella majae]|uniref:hypothetical protein n=1 Tax=Kiloniella majae TaxID=1938558 RepID=UPI000A27880F|nr:hypothetical protein [Kiloniella majae]